MIVPSTVTAGPPAEIVSPATATAEESNVKVWPAVVYVGRTLMVELPMTSTPDGPRLTTVPLTVTAGPPADKEVPAMGKAEGFGVKV